MQRGILGEEAEIDSFKHGAYALLFSKEPDRSVPGCKIRFLRFDGEHEGTGDKFNAVKDVWIEGVTVPKLIEGQQTPLLARSEPSLPLQRTASSTQRLSILQRPGTKLSSMLAFTVPMETVW